MAFREDLEAAQARIGALEEELADARAKIARLENPPKAAEPTPRAQPKQRVRASSRFGSLYYHAPKSYVPFLGLWRSAAKAAWVRRPTIERPDSDAVWRWALYVLLLPITYAVRLPLYAVAMCIALPAAAVLCAALTALVLPFLALSRLSFSPRAPQEQPSWWTGEESIGGGAMFLWMLMSMCMQPFLLVTTSLLTED